MNSIVDPNGLRVLHLHSDVGGNAWHLAKGECLLGLQSKVLTSRTNWMQYPADIELHLENNRSRMGKLAQLVITFLRYRSAYDIFHFNFGSALLHYPQMFMNQLDIPFYPANSHIFVTYNGCDARQKDLTVAMNPVAPCHNPNCFGGACNDGSLDHARRNGIKKMAHYARHLWAKNPDLLNFLPPKKSSFLPYAVSMSGEPPSFKPGTGRLKILHAPTDRIIKGTQYLLDALNRLRGSHGDCFELMLVENMIHCDALKLYRAADLVVDQLHIGWYGGFAVEAMLLGKPVIAWIATKDLHYIPAAMARDLEDGLICASPGTLYEVLATFIENRARLADYAEAGYLYARKWHDPVYVASITKRKYEESLSTTSPI
ncbi:MAG: glycosyltransferase family 4 protein [Candidatus Tectomicrobia bacterium]|uniref:Glycosyltransferase family 4 protein n=1 Tax=Tectimicrobiota bacterium TaxID=2528274 RepID=A0A937VZA0_UNCTE|nr:glycosyltransferase family 4 protein [Candidatus Tectomicrobia bacterium]